MSGRLGKAPEVPRAVAEAVVAATRSRQVYGARQNTLIPLLGLLFLFCLDCNAVTLPKERADILYHRYDGGGMVIDGPSVLVRKNFEEKISVSGNYYVDNVSSASIDVITSGASEYTEERTEYSADITAINDKSLVNIGYTNSDESDYTANSYRIDISQDFFGDQLTASLGYSQADDEVRNNLDDSFLENVDRRHYRAGISFIFARWGYLSFNYEGIVDEGFLNNPYRTTRSLRRFDANLPAVAGNLYLDPLAEVYPNTRNSDAFSAKVALKLPWSGALKARGSYFSDSWSINAWSGELEYTHKYKQHWIMDVRGRYYEQSGAEFFYDYIPVDLDPTFRARDKELSTYNNYSLGFGLTYKHKLRAVFDEVSASLQYDHIWFRYDEFRDTTESIAVISIPALDAQPLYEFDAYALRLFLTLTY